MLLTFLYHHYTPLMKEHLRYLSQNYPIVLPGDPIPLLKTSICLTFDDAYFDFYYSIYPLLKEYKIKALLAVPVGLIPESSNLTPEERLKTSTNDQYCSWKELEEMQSSGLVEIASHSYYHKNLLLQENLELEIIESKNYLEKRLKKKVTTFVYPYGKFDRKLHSYVKKHYKTIMRIGSSSNFSWRNMHQMTYRIPMDHLLKKDQNLHPLKKLSFMMAFISNTLRMR